MTKNGNLKISKLQTSWILVDPCICRLAVKGKKVTSDDYISVDFVHACVKENRLLDMDKYRYEKYLSILHY